MRALILAGGYGERLKPLTNNIPKCLVKVQNKPLLEFWYYKLKEIGYSEIYYNSHFKHELVNDFVKRKNLSLINIYEKELLGTGGTLLNNLNKFINQDLLVLHCDNYTKDNLNNFLMSHNNRPNSCELTLYTFKTDYPEQCGIIESNNNIVHNIKEKVKGVNGNLANGAIYIFSKESLNKLLTFQKGFKDIVIDLLPAFFNKIYIYRSTYKFIDIGTHENLQKANLF